MAYPSGSFSSEYSGQLQVTFHATFSSSSGYDYGATGSGDLVIRCYVGTGESRTNAILRFNTNSTVIDVPYVGGSGNVAVGMEYVSHTYPGGPSSVSGTKLTINCYLIKR